MPAQNSSMLTGTAAIQHSLKATHGGLGFQSCPRPCCSRPALSAPAGSRPAAFTLGASSTRTPSRATYCTTMAGGTSSQPCGAAACRTVHTAGFAAELLVASRDAGLVSCQLASRQQSGTSGWLMMALRGSLRLANAACPAWSRLWPPARTRRDSAGKSPAFFQLNNTKVFLCMVRQQRRLLLHTDWLRLCSERVHRPPSGSGVARRLQVCCCTEHSWLWALAVLLGALQAEGARWPPPSPGHNRGAGRPHELGPAL